MTGACSHKRCAFLQALNPPPVPARILPVANQAPHKTEGLPRRLVSYVLFKARLYFNARCSEDEKIASDCMTLIDSDEL
jgi:hypothetical protein